MVKNWEQGRVFFIFLGVYAISAFLVYSFFAEQMTAAVGAPMPDLGVPVFLIGLANAAIVLVVYGVLGMVGFWFARKLDLPGIYRQSGNWRQWVLTPLLLGVICGCVLIIGDFVFSKFNGFGRFPHPDFPASILVSISAGIGEEIAFRGFVFGLWGIIFQWMLQRFKGRRTALMGANVIAALAFGAGHLGSLTYLTGVQNLNEINPFLFLEILLLNGIVGIAAGDQYIKHGLVAAIGVHFWTDVVFHVWWGLV